MAAYAAVVFKVFIDGKLAAASPVMRIESEPWRFDVAIPKGSRQISPVCDYEGSGKRPPAGAQSPYNLGNWVEAGFCTKPKDEGQKPADVKEQKP